MNTRRELLIVLCAGASIPWTLFAQSRKSPVLIGWLNSESRFTSAALGNLAAFKEEMASRGWKEDANYVLEERWAEGQRARLPSLGAELAARNPTLIVAANGIA